VTGHRYRGVAPAAPIPADGAVSDRAPAGMPAAVVAELGTIFATGYLRSLFGQKALDDRGPVEAACRPVNGAESAKESVA
jgi:hypothetical protein